MRRRAQSLKENAELTADVAIVGAGPMGIVTALELARRGHRVLLLETGFAKPSDEAQRLSTRQDEDLDSLHAPSGLAVRRQLGGTSVTWGGRCVPFDPIDFEPRPAMPERLWPVAYEDFAAFLPRACEWCVCGRSVFDAERLPELAGRALVPGLPDGDVRASDLERWSLPTRFFKKYGPELDRNPLIELITGLTCTRIACEGRVTSVSHLELRSLDGLRATVRAERYVLAAGGLESTRLLLASDDTHPGGVGNHSGHLGRWYMAHVQGRVARIHFTTPPGDTIYGYERDEEGVYVRRRLTLSEDLQKRHLLPNCAVWIVNPELGDAAHGSGILSGVYLTLISPLGRLLLAEALRQIGTKTSRPSPIRAHVANVVRDLRPAIRFAASFLYARYLRPGIKAPGFFVRSAVNTYPVEYHGEHRPHWESRVELSEEQDSLGMPRLRTAIHFDREDLLSVGTALGEIDAYLREKGVGRLEYLFADIEAAVAGQLRRTAGYHQTGTTRMSASAEDGVVDPDLKVHGVDNLYVAATSVFPTSSQANPTLTGVAFAVRLADHLCGTLESETGEIKAQERS